MGIAWGGIQRFVMCNSVVDEDNYLLDNARMHLSEYLTRKKIRFADFAQQIGVSQEAVRLYVRGKRYPRPGVMEKISAATEGKVRPNDFFPGRGAVTAGAGKAA